MLPIILFIITVPTVATFGVWHYAGYFNGRWERLAAEEAQNGN